jgi:hypothetical protein
MAIVRERLAVSKQTTHEFLMEKLNSNKLSEIECKKQHYFEI